MVHTLRWDQVHTWRLLQHSLLGRARHPDWLDIVRRVGGIHAQLMSSAGLSLTARVDGFRSSHVDDALWRDRTLVKTWAMRGTLHLLAVDEYPLYVTACSALLGRGSSSRSLAAIVKAVPEIVDEVPLTREDLANTLAERTGRSELGELVRWGWGSYLKSSAFRGDLCFGPNAGSKVTFVRPSRWIGAWQPVEPKEAFQEMARRYLRAYGPARAEDFARWWGAPAGQARRALESLGDEVEPVDVEGWQGLALASSVAALKSVEPVESVRLLPRFDAYTVGLSRDCEAVLPVAYRPRVYRPQGWISAVVLVNGRMAGTWEHRRQGARTLMRVAMFEPPMDEVRQGIEAEAERLGGFLGTDVEVAFA